MCLYTLVFVVEMIWGVISLVCMGWLGLVFGCLLVVSFVFAVYLFVYMLIILL